MKNYIYLVGYTTGNHSDYQTHNHKAFTDKKAAEKEKEALEERSRKIPDFPFKKYTEEEMYGSDIPIEDWNKYMKWFDKKIAAQDFNGAYVEKIELK